MEFKGTKGQWKLQQSKNDTFDYDVQIVGICGFFSQPNDTSDDDEMMYYNALLASKAPEMLEMLQKINNIENEDFCKESFNIEDLKRKLSRLIQSATELY